MLYYLGVVWDNVLQILSVIGRIFVMLLACGFAGGMLFFIEFLISLILPEKIVNKEWFSSFVIISCMIAGVVVAIVCLKALFF